MTASFISLIASAGFLLLTLLFVAAGWKRGMIARYLTAFLLCSAVTIVLKAILQDEVNLVWVRYLAGFTLGASLAFLYLLTSVYSRWNDERRIVIGGLVSIVVLVAIIWIWAGELAVNPNIDRLFSFPPLEPGGITLMVLWLLGAAILVLRTLIASARARLPLHANRLLFWAGTLGLTLSGQFLSSTSDSTFTTMGYLLHLLGAGGLFYGVLSYRVIDVRRLVRTLVSFMLSVTFTTGLIILAILIIQIINTGEINRLPGTAIVGVSVSLSILFQLIQPQSERLINRVIIQSGSDPAIIVNAYSRKIGNILDIDTLSSVAVGTLREVFGIRRGNLMVVTRDENNVHVQPSDDLDPKTTSMSFLQSSPIFWYFRQNRQPLYQYDIDMLPEFGPLSLEQRRWLSILQMDVFVPIMTDEIPIGLLAVGPKSSGEPFRSDEMQLLQTLAGQTVVALTNARLFNNLKQLNAEIQTLNADLRHSNERLQYMDQVKSDFITIASHELRTPLTQIKGYADILDAMNEGDLLTNSETERIVSSINTAAIKLESILTAMLDVSQIDVDAMSLNLVETSLDTILRMAIQPLVTAMRERRLALSIQGVRNLPVIRADFQRLVQAVSNLVSNAVKYTPDGGNILIQGDLVQGDTEIDGQIELVFSDTGVGIDPRDQEMVFEKFFRSANWQLHSTGTTKYLGAGPGLGLSIVRGIIEAHGGRIWVESAGYNPDACPGSQFHIVLPILPPQTKESQQEPVPSDGRLMWE